MRVAQEQVEEFHAHIGEVIADAPTRATAALVERRGNIISEEVTEYVEAGLRGDLVEVADAIGDMLYTVIGAAVMHGIDIQPIFEEIHRSNMTKDKADGVKLCVKGERFERPRIAELLLIQSTGLEV